MTGSVIPLQRQGEEASALGRVDTAAIVLLAEGRAATLTAARIDAILANVCTHRAELVAMIA